MQLLKSRSRVGSWAKRHLKWPILLRWWSKWWVCLPLDILGMVIVLQTIDNISTRYALPSIMRYTMYGVGGLISGTLGEPMFRRAGRSRSRRLRHKLVLRGLCPNCKYDLRATSGRCPECGLRQRRVDRDSDDPGDEKI